MPDNYPTDRIYKAVIILFLLTTTVALYWQVSNHTFLKYDDTIYVTENPHISGGFNLTSIKWAFTSIYGANWHPLTWLSHTLDVQLFGMNPAGHHLVSVFIHATNAILLFLLLNRTTRAIWRSAVVAALFAFHPLHVESVAWVAERKDVLSALFGLLCLYQYARYAERPNVLRYAAVFSTLALGLMAKPMLVTLPFVMLMFDYWPLQRFVNGQGHNNAPTHCNRPFKSLLIEKIPFLFLVAASSAATSFAQYTGRAIATLQDSPLSERIVNALLSYLLYLGKMVWPHNLAVFYPFRTDVPLWQLLSAVTILAGITTLTIRSRKQHPYMIVGWLWYLCTLIPVIGIVRVGLQSMADRYTYLPLTGIFIMVVWGITDIANHFKLPKTILPFLALCIITTSGAISWNQIGFWRTSATLFTHAKEATADNFLAYYVLGGILVKEGKLEEALENFNEAVRIAPWYEYAKMQQDIILFNQGRLDAAVLRYSKAITQNPTSVSDHISLGIVMALQEKFDEAESNFRRALYLNPLSDEAHYNLAMTLSQSARLEEAVEHYQKALEITPNDVNTLNNMGVTLAKLGKIDEAIRLFSTALELKPGFFDARNNLELARKKQKQTPLNPDMR